MVVRTVLAGMGMSVHFPLAVVCVSMLVLVNMLVGVDMRMLVRMRYAPCVCSWLCTCVCSWP